MSVSLSEKLLEKAVDFIVAEIRRDPQNIIENLKKKIASLSQPQGQRKF